MPYPKLPSDVIMAIQGASLTETSDCVGERLGVSGRTVRTYRREARAERQEAAREVLAEHVHVHLPDALADLSELRRRAREAYETSGDARQGTLWLAAIRTTLEHIAPGDADLDAAIQHEIARVASGTGGNGYHAD
jgi:hypothetical protein